MSKKKKSPGAQKRKQEQEKNLAKAEKRRAADKKRAETQRKELVELIRTGKLKISKDPQNKGILSTHSSLQCQPKIRRGDVVIDAHTSTKKEQNLYRLEGDTGWV